MKKYFLLLFVSDSYGLEGQFEIITVPYTAIYDKLEWIRFHYFHNKFATKTQVCNGLVTQTFSRRFTNNRNLIIQRKQGTTLPCLNRMLQCFNLQFNILHVIIFDTLVSTENDILPTVTYSLSTLA